MKITKFIATEECTWKRNDQGEMAAFTVACPVADLGGFHGTPLARKSHMHSSYISCLNSPGVLNS